MVPSHSLIKIVPKQHKTSTVFIIVPQRAFCFNVTALKLLNFICLFSVAKKQLSRRKEANTGLYY